MYQRSMVAIAAAAALASGCGGNDERALSKSQVIARGTVICKAAERRAERLPQLTVEHPFAKGTSSSLHRTARRFLAGYADALDSSRIGLAKLDAPKDGKPLLDGYLRDIGTVVADLRSASRAPGPAVEDKANAAFGLFEKASRQTAAYGFPKGVCGAG